MNYRKLHQAAMHLGRYADAAIKSQDKELALELYGHAADLEGRVCEFVEIMLAQGLVRSFTFCVYSHSHASFLLLAQRHSQALNVALPLLKQTGCSPDIEALQFIIDDCNYHINNMQQ